MITYFYSCFVMSQPRLVQGRGLASARWPCPRRSRLGTSSHPLHPSKTLRYIFLASIAWKCVLCAHLETALGLGRRKVHILYTIPRTSMAENTLNAIYVCICAYMRILCVGCRRSTSHCLGSLSGTSGPIQPPPAAPHQITGNVPSTKVLYVSGVQ